MPKSINQNLRPSKSINGIKKDEYDELTITTGTITTGTITTATITTGILSELRLNTSSIAVNGNITIPADGSMFFLYDGGIAVGFNADFNTATKVLGKMIFISNDTGQIMTPTNVDVATTLAVGKNRLYICRLDDDGITLEWRALNAPS